MTPLLLYEKQEESLAYSGFLRMLNQFINLYIHAKSLSTRWLSALSMPSSPSLMASSKASNDVIKSPFVVRQIRPKNHLKTSAIRLSSG
jgi:hypothetical protein